MNTLYHHSDKHCKPYPCFWEYSCAGDDNVFFPIAWKSLLTPLNALPRGWHYQAREVVRPYLWASDMSGLARRLREIHKVISQLNQLGLTLSPSRSDLSYAFEHLSETDKEQYKTASQLGWHVYKLIETAGRQLGIQSVEQSAVTKHTRALMEQHRKNTAQTLENTWIERDDAVFNLAAVTQGQENRRAAETLHRLEDVTTYYTKDCKYNAVLMTIIPPPEHHPGHAGHINPRWFDAGQPTPKDTAVHMNGQFAKLRAACRKHGIKLKGYKTVEAHAVGVPHFNFQFFVENDEQLEIIKRHAQRLFGTEETKNSKRSIISKNDTPQAWRMYISKNLPQPIAAPHYDDEGVSPQSPRDSSVDTDFCRLWGIRQVEFFGQQPIEFWRTLQRLDRDQLSDPDFMKDIPPRVLSAIMSAGGFCIMDGQIAHAEYDYRAFLLLTEPDSPLNKSRVNGALIDVGPLLLKTRCITPQQISFALVDGAARDVAITLDMRLSHWQKIKKISPDLLNCNTSSTKLQLRIRQLTRKIDTSKFTYGVRANRRKPPAPPPVPLWKTGKYTFGIRQKSI